VVERLGGRSVPWETDNTKNASAEDDWVHLTAIIDYESRRLDATSHNLLGILQGEWSRFRRPGAHRRVDPTHTAQRASTGPPIRVVIDWYALAEV